MGNPYDDIRKIRLETDEFFPLSFCMDAYLNREQDVQKTINYLNDLRDDKKELTPEERKQLEKYKCQAERRTRGGWTPGKIVGMIIGVIFIGLFIFLLVRHVNDDTPWGMLLSIIPGIIGGCIVISSFPKKHNGLSAREKELRLCNITGQTCSLVFLLSLLAIIVFIFLVCFKVVGADPLIYSILVFVGSIVMLVMAVGRENQIKTMSDEEYIEEQAQIQEEDRRKAEEERAFKKKWHPIKRVLFFWAAVDIIHSTFKNLFKNPNDSRKS